MRAPSPTAPRSPHPAPPSSLPGSFVGAQAQVVATAPDEASAFKLRRSSSNQLGPRRAAVGANLLSADLFSGMGRKPAPPLQALQHAALLDSDNEDDFVDLLKGGGVDRQGLSQGIQHMIDKLQRKQQLIDATSSRPASEHDEAPDLEADVIDGGRIGARPSAQEMTPEPFEPREGLPTRPAEVAVATAPSSAIRRMADRTQELARLASSEDKLTSLRAEVEMEASVFSDDWAPPQLARSTDLTGLQAVYGFLRSRCRMPMEKALLDPDPKALRKLMEQGAAPEFAAFTAWSKEGEFRSAFGNAERNLQLLVDRDEPKAQQALRLQKRLGEMVAHPEFDFACLAAQDGHSSHHLAMVLLGALPLDADQKARILDSIVVKLQGKKDHLPNPWEGWFYNEMIPDIVQRFQPYEEARLAAMSDKEKGELASSLAVRRTQIDALQALDAQLDEEFDPDDCIDRFHDKMQAILERHPDLYAGFKAQLSQQLFNDRKVAEHGPLIPTQRFPFLRQMDNDVAPGHAARRVRSLESFRKGASAQPGATAPQPDRPAVPNRRPSLA